MLRRARLPSKLREERKQAAYERSASMQARSAGGCEKRKRAATSARLVARRTRAARSASKLREERKASCATSASSEERMPNASCERSARLLAARRSSARQAWRSACCEERDFQASCARSASKLRDRGAQEGRLRNKCKVLREHRSARSCHAIEGRKALLSLSKLRSRGASCEERLLRGAEREAGCAMSATSATSAKQVACDERKLLREERARSCERSAR
jgi:hypothetical protein